MYKNQIRKKSCADDLGINLFNGFGWKITIHGNKIFDINRKTPRSVIALSIKPIL